MVLAPETEMLFLLLRAGLRTEKPDDAERLRSLCAARTPDWPAIYKLASHQGVLAIVWDGLERFIREDALAPEHRPTRTQKIQWGYNVERIEQTWERQRQAIGQLSAFFEQHKIPMMVLKGYGTSLCYPVPKHRPCGDIDIWLFGQQEQADRLLHEEKGIAIDIDKHHHTTFTWNGILVENHFDFLNVHAHLSNRTIEGELQRHAANPDNNEKIDIERHALYLPSPDFNALFLLRHAAIHFAAAEIGLRHIADWGVFIQRYHDRVDWAKLEAIAHEQNMHRFLYCMNACCTNLLGTDPHCFPAIPRDWVLEQRVLNEILNPGFTSESRKRGLLGSLSFKFRRWWANRWKHRIVYKENLFWTFLIQVYSHLLKPKSLIK